MGVSTWLIVVPLFPIFSRVAPLPQVVGNNKSSSMQWREVAVVIVIVAYRNKP